MNPRAGIVLVALCGGVSAVAASDLSVWMTVDNTFTAYLSTDPMVQGTQFLSGGSWPTTDQAVVSLDQPGTYYLQVRAVDLGSPEMFIGRFTLDGDGLFANGTQELLTLADSGDWTASATGFGGPAINVLDVGANGISPWGNFPLMTGARFIWAGNTASQFDTVYFTASFTVVPTPATAGLLGVAGLAGMRRRR